MEHQRGGGKSYAMSGVTEGTESIAMANSRPARTIRSYCDSMIMSSVCPVLLEVVVSTVPGAVVFVTVVEAPLL